tara:strand:+ start:274 stop:1143 length:870 start_codon:yes stop_codon:yes gene_type:complete
MARSIDTIANAMIAAKEADSNLDGLTSASRTAIWRLWIYIVAAAINVFEQLQDVYQAEIEAIADTAIPGTLQWVQDRTFRFQYDATVPQVLTINDDLELVYGTVVDDYKIVTRCSVTTNVNKLVSIKVAKDTSSTDTTPIQLDTAQEDSLTSYWALSGVAGITYAVVNKVSDKVGITATVYYQGQYSATIAADVELALNDYLAAIPFDGKLRVSQLEDTIQAVDGVNDYVLEEVICRDDATVYASGVKVFDLNASPGVNLRLYSPQAGYTVEETTASYTFADTISYVAQ